ncbi:uncharacterized protein LOC129241036 isoform X2 [Anastrepha obliqua]|uniref:uncharacterized protein LOC129241036 isoform X2 n=1 Tax=Anastrepha obliqua TaxID=95512 RepID=UPI00240A35FC|nr:uncharacterized protein LOC129241036 isoform X2 [Anastrepha obliqua]
MIKMAQQRTPAALAAINYYQICLALVISIVWLTHDACALPAVGGVNTPEGIPHYSTRQQADMQQIMLNELLNNVNEDVLYNELKKYQRKQYNHLSKWPALRGPLLMADYDENFADSSDAHDSSEMPKIRFVERLRQLAANSIDDIDDERADNHPFIPTAMPPKRKPQSAPVVFKDHGTKKNIQLHKQYMSPCHFKICNMGRKRNARFFED